MRAYMCARSERSWDEARVAAFCAVSLFRLEPQNNVLTPKQSRNAAPTSPKWSLLASFRSDVSDEKVTLKTRAGNVCLALCVSPFGFKGKTFYVGIVGKSWNGY